MSIEPNGAGARPEVEDVPQQFNSLHVQVTESSGLVDDFDEYDETPEDEE